MDTPGNVENQYCFNKGTTCEIQTVTEVANI